MDVRALASLITRTAGLVLLVIALADFPYRFADFAYAELRTGVTFLGTVVLPVALPLVVGLALIIWPGRVANSLVAPSSDEPPKIPDALQSLVFAAIGLYLAADAALDLIWLGTFHFMAQAQGGYDVLADPQNSASLVTGVLGLGLGLILIFGAKGLTGFVRGLRRTGQP
ncbi:MAG: hypothetical protein AAF495_01890 [Pseudomonadota bacterium]